MLQFRMRNLLLLIFIFLLQPLWCADISGKKPYKPYTSRVQPAQYLSTDENAVEDTCPNEDIINQFFCTKEEPVGFTCFDVYRVQGDPVDNERYTLLNEQITTEQTTAEPKCTFEGEFTCANFLKSLKYNLDFSWFIDNFPSSSFLECGKTYTCTRIACLRPLAQNEQTGGPQAQKLTCVFKKNQIYFLGTRITCENKNTPKAQQTPPQTQTTGK